MSRPPRAHRATFASPLRATARYAAALALAAACVASESPPLDKGDLVGGKADSGDACLEIGAEPDAQPRKQGITVTATGDECGRPRQR